jgi:hypothetical protein
MGQIKRWETVIQKAASMKNGQYKKARIKKGPAFAGPF